MAAAPAARSRPDSYCFGEVLSVCWAGSCQVDPATALPLGAGFELDGAGTTSPAGLHLTERSMIHTTTAVHYPVLVEATVVYSGDDVTYLGTRGDGLRDPMAGGEPTDTLRARLSPGLVELATGPDTTVIASTPAGFSPTPGTPYRVRYFDDGFFASVEWFNLVNPGQGIGLQQITSYHGADDRAFLGGGDQGALTVSNLRVCSAPALPVTAGLLAHYSAVPSWTLEKDPQGNVGAWGDARGTGVPLQATGFPVFQGGLVGGQGPGVDFAGGTRPGQRVDPAARDRRVGLRRARLPRAGAGRGHRPSRRPRHRLVARAGQPGPADPALADQRRHHQHAPDLARPGQLRAGRTVRRQPARYSPPPRWWAAADAGVDRRRQPQHHRRRSKLLYVGTLRRG